jgi:hypothetical protein
MTTCNPNALQSFPIGVSIPITYDLYYSVLQPLSFDFQWGTRNTPPHFTSSTNGLLDETDTSTVRYNGYTYRLESVQFTDPTHKRWIIPSDAQINNWEDIVLTFSYSVLGSNSTDYLVIIVPIIRVPQAADPNYFTSIGTTGNSQQISLKSVIPSGSSTTFAYYATCTNGLGGNVTQNVLNIVSVDGIQVTDLTMARIKTVFKNSTTLNSYGGYTPPLAINYSNTPTTLTTSDKFRQHVNITTNILVVPAAGSNPNPHPVDEPLEAYKCVPFDPESQVVNGKITVDPTTGKLLSTVQANREALKNGIPNPEGLINSVIYSKYVSTALALIFTLIIGLIVIFFFVGAAIGPSAIGHGPGVFHRAYKSLTNVPTYLTIGILCAFIGFMGGMVLKHRK